MRISLFTYCMITFTQFLNSTTKICKVLSEKMKATQKITKSIIHNWKHINSNFDATVEIIFTDKKVSKYQS